MTALLEKDLRLLLVRKSAILIFIVIGVVFTWEFSSSFSGAYLTMLGALLALSTLSYDDTDNCMEFLFTLPCTRKQYVIEKYLFVYGISLLAGLIAIVIIIGSGIIQGTTINALTFVEIIASEIPILVATGGILIPLQLKFGLEKSRNVLLALIGCVFVVAYTFAKIADIGSVLESLVVTLDTMNPVGIIIGLVVILAILSAGSMMASMRIVENREF